MEEFRNSVITVCIVTAASAILGNLVSGTRLKNQIQLMLDLVSAIAVITPFTKGGSPALPELNDIDTPDYSYSQELYNEELKRQTSENVRDVLMQQIQAAGINCVQLEVLVNISEDGSISISRVIVSSDSFEAAAEIIRNSLGADTEVLNGDT